MSLNPRDAVIVDYARSAMGRSKNGCFRNVRADDLSADVINGMLARNTALDPAEISHKAITGEDDLCVSALEIFCALLGSVCGDFLLATGSYGGLYLAGGIVPEISSFVRDSSFRRRMIEKGAMGETLAGIPVYAITSSQPGLLGAARVPL